jgi:hypothetical protein
MSSSMTSLGSSMGSTKSEASKNARAVKLTRYGPNRYAHTLQRTPRLGAHLGHTARAHRPVGFVVVGAHAIRSTNPANSAALSHAQP